MGIHTTGPAVKNHTSSEMARELVAIYPTMYHLWFLVYQRVLPQLHLHLLLHHLHYRIPYLMSTDTPKIQYQIQVEVRVKSFGETRCIKNCRQIHLTRHFSHALLHTQSDVRTHCMAQDEPPNVSVCARHSILMSSMMSV